MELNFSKDKKDLVSIIMPSYNCGRFVEDTIRSVQAQTYQNWEILFVDDCSTDDTIRIVSEMKDKDERIHLYQNVTNCGAAVSRNIALKAAKGRWIAFLDSDDLWEPEKLEKQIRFMEAHNYSFSYTETVHIDEDSKLLGRYVTGPECVTNSLLHWYCWMGCLTVMYDKNVIGLIQIEDLKKNNDYAIWLKVVKKANCYLLKERLARYRERSGSISSSKPLILLKWHYWLYRKGEKNSILSSCVYTVMNIIGSFVKKKIYTKEFANY